MSQEAPQAQQTQNGILPQPYRVTQHAGNYNPNVEIYSGGYARDTNFAAPVNTPVALPPGKWGVVKTYDRARPIGGPRGENSGYGNMVQVVNPEGESMIFQHLSGVSAQPGKVLEGGALIGTTGSSGNSTGYNLGIEAKDKTGRIVDITKTPHAQHLFSR